MCLMSKSSDLKEGSSNSGTTPKPILSPTVTCCLKTIYPFRKQRLPCHWSYANRVLLASWLERWRDLRKSRWLSRWPFKCRTALRVCYEMLWKHWSSYLKISLKCYNCLIFKLKPNFEPLWIIQSAIQLIGKRGMWLVCLKWAAIQSKTTNGLCITFFPIEKMKRGHEDIICVRIPYSYWNNICIFNVYKCLACM